MKQYLNLLREIKEKGTIKPAARENMPGTLSLFGAQYRCDLSKGFPLLTTKKLSFKNIVTELLWFLRGDTNIKYLVDNGCNIWNEDAYNYYKKLFPKNTNSFEDFIKHIKENENPDKYCVGEGVNTPNYTLGDCGWQYGKLWRDWDGIDQISELVNGLKNNPESRRHILTALNPAHYNDLALFPCHTTVQFNCRPLTVKERSHLAADDIGGEKFASYSDDFMEGLNIPKYYLDCHLYQRSCDVFLGVPYNTASYSLLTHLLAEMLNFEVGDFIHTFGDVHIYENHMNAVNEQLERTPDSLPKLVVFPRSYGYLQDNVDKYFASRYTLNDFLKSLDVFNFKLEEYNPQPQIKAKLSTGLK